MRIKIFSYFSKVSFILFFGFYILCCDYSFAQKESNNWYFGNTAGVTFNTNPPTALTDGALNASEGCASISDENGNLLFYSNGISVWNKNHLVMPNGNGLLGAGTSTQSSLIVKQPGSANLYYIFTVPDQSTSGRYTYSVVDMSLSGGLGNITSVKNANLLTNFSNAATVFNATEALTAVYHENQSDIWVIVHEYNTNRFYSFLLNSLGLQNPIASTVGNQTTNLGQCRFSPDGTKIAVGGYFGSGAELYSFNSSTGVISNPITVVPNGIRIYGLSFSPNSNVLYVTNNNATLFQYDATQTTSANIQATQYIVGTGSGGFYPQLQLGPDSKIYMAQRNFSYLGIINNPNVLGVGCSFLDNGISLSGKTSALGLPTFMVNYVTPYPPIVNLGNDTTLCISETLLLDAKNPGATYLWSTGAQTQTITINQSGTYFVDVTNAGGTTRDEIIIDYAQFSSITIPFTYYFCKSTDVPFTLNPSFTEMVYHWNDLTSIIPFTISDTGVYWLERELDNCTKRDTFTVLLNCVELGSDTTLCESQILVLDAKIPNSTYLWNTGAQTQTITVTQPGTYFVDVTNAGGTTRDEIQVDYAQFSTISIPSTYSFCKNTDTPISLNPSFTETIFHWNNLSSTLPYIITEPGIYWLERIIGNCKLRDTFTVIANCPTLPMVIPNLITVNNDDKNDMFYIENLPTNLWNVVIYNRWGDLVFKEAPYQNNWDCKEVSDGVYYFELYSDDSSNKYKGWLQVMR